MYTEPSAADNVQPNPDVPVRVPAAPGGGVYPPDPFSRYGCACPDASVNTTDSNPCVAWL